MDKEEVKPQDAIDHRDRSDIDWESRILCRDGNCIGLIGTNGRCRECDLIYNTDQESDADFETDAIAVHETHETAYDDDVADEGDEGGSVDDEDAFIPDSDWEKRTLCNDGNCIGIIDSDGCCRECGMKQDSANNLSGTA